MTAHVQKIDFPTPDPYGPNGCDIAIHHELGCASNYFATYEVMLFEGGARWMGFVHEFDLVKHARSRKAFCLVRPVADKGREFTVYWDAQGITNAELAARRFRSEQAKRAPPASAAS